MKIRRLILTLALLMGVSTMEAAPVSLEEALSLGQRFVSSCFEPTRQEAGLTLVYSAPSYYVFNVGNSGFVILSSDDSYRPVIGYSKEGTFNPNDMAPALQAYLDGIDEDRASGAVCNDPMMAREDWASLRNNGHLVSRYGGRDSEYLVRTKWNQNYPYNYCCPADADGPGGHVYAGCVATAGAQLMKYWNHPIHGTGSHAYIPEDNPQYGPITVNFGEATYDWDNMPMTIASSSPIEEIEAVATLIYHVGVSVDMNYRPTGSGATTTKLCEVMPTYFYYSDQMTNINRSSCSREEYLGYIFEAIDMRWPMAHRGGGHAYVLDGYDDFGLVHFNWGWSGSNDGFFDIDDHNYTDGESVIYNYVPADVYAATPDAPTGLTVIPAEDNVLSTTVSWTNPTITITNQPLTSIDQIVVMRGTDVIFTQDNVAPGEVMEIVDDAVPYFDAFKYHVYAVVNGQRGKTISVDGINVGPTCPWKFVMSSSDMMGWKGSYVAVRNALGTVVGQLAVTNSTPVAQMFDMPLGSVSFEWVPVPGVTILNMALNIKDSNGNSVFSFSGNANGMEAGVFYEGNNDCGSSVVCDAPSALTAVQDPDDDHAIVLNWTGVDDPGYGYLIYRDTVVFRLITDGSTQFRDENVPVGGHSYQVAVLCEGGLSGEFSNMDCVPSGPCFAPRNLDFEMSSSFKCKLKWDRPEPSDGLSGYVIFRKKDDGTYKRIKIAGPNSSSYTDSSVNEEGDYYYKILAYYGDLDSYSAPAARKYAPHEYCLHFVYSVTGLDEMQREVKVYPNPSEDDLMIEAEGLVSVELCNVLGQTVTAHSKNVMEGAMMLDLRSLESGIYLVRVHTKDGVTVRQIVKK